MTSREPHELVTDILESARLARTYVDDLGFDVFRKDRKTQDSVVLRLQVIGEAAGKLPASVTAAMPQVPWPQIKSMRNFLAHQYFDIDYTRVWAVVQDDLPPLITAIEDYLRK